MSDLQVGLLAVGIAVVIVVLLYNKLQEVRFRRQAEVNLKALHTEELSETDTAVADASVLDPARVEPTLSEQDDDTVVLPPPGPAEEAGESACLSDSVDFIVTLEAAEGIAGCGVIESAATELSGFKKAVRLEGHNGVAWESLREEQRYTRMRIGMQLADRRGSVTQEDLAAFASAVEKTAVAAGAIAVPAESEAAIATAEQLDRFCSEVDIRIAVHVVARDKAFAGTRIRALAETAGLVLEEDGRFRRRDEQGMDLFSLANEEAPAFKSDTMRALTSSALVLELDLPRAPGGARAFAQFRDFAQRLAAGLGGNLVDDNRSALGAAAFDSIAAQIDPVYQAMDRYGIPSGSPLALRLFS
jgi:FtsZ-interacting cell division protein ZipA